MKKTLLLLAGIARRRAVWLALTAALSGLGITLGTDQQDAIANAGQVLGALLAAFIN